MSSGSSLVQCPEAVETAALHFKALSKNKIFDKDITWCDGNVNLVAISQHYGLTFIGTSNGFLILKSKELFSPSTHESHQKEILLNSKASHLAVDFEQKHLAVGCQTKIGPIVFVYNIPSFLTKGVSPIKTVPLSKPFQNPAIQLCELMWQPNTDSGLTVCFSDGSVSSLNLFQGSGNDIFTLPNTTQARCLCWSPKGKQLVIGCGDGTLSQYRPDLKFVKKLGAPPVSSGPITVVNIHWISSFQFVAAYKDTSKTEDFPFIAIVNAPKNEPMRFVNYDDITYSSMLFRAHQLYFYHLSAWNIMFVASANSIEVAVLHANEDNSVWEQWLLGDASRAELPLNSEKVETFPLGFAIDFTSEQVIPWGEDSLPPMPRLLLLSSEGVLTTFHIINIAGNIPQLCSPPKETFDDSWFTVNEKNYDSTVLNKVNQPSESLTSQANSLESTKLAQDAVSTLTFTPVSSVGSVHQTGIIASAGFTNNKIQTSKQQTLTTIQPMTQDQQYQAGTAQIFPTPNSSLKWPQKLAFSVPFMGTVGSSLGDQNSANAMKKDNQFGKNAEQNTSAFNIQTVTGTPTVLSETKESVPFKTPQKPMGDSKGNNGEVKTGAPTSFTNVEHGKVISAESPSAVKTINAKTPESSPSRSTPDLAAIDESVYVTALLDEVEQFNSELKEVLSRVSTLKVYIGTEEEKTFIRTSVEKLNELRKELNDTTSSQKTEIQGLKTDVIEAFAWLEDAKSRNRQRKSETFVGLKKSENLDPISSRLMSEIGHLKYYIENQLKQLHSYLMREWMEHEDNCRLDIKTMMTIPSMEELYKTMHLELKILSKQRAIVEELRRKVQDKHRPRSQTSLIARTIDSYSRSVDSKRVSELSKLADNLLQIRIDRDEQISDNYVVDASQLIIKNQINAIAERSKKLSMDKQSVLRDILSEREMMKTRSAKSTLGTSSFVRSTSSRIQSSYLATPKTSCVGKTAKMEFTKESRGDYTSTPARTAEKVTSGTVQNFQKIGRGFESDFQSKEASISSQWEISSVSGKQDAPKSMFTFKSPEFTSKSESEKSNELFTFSTSKSASASNENGQKITPFVFKASPIPTSGISSPLISKSPVTTSATVLNPAATTSLTQSAAKDNVTAPAVGSKGNIFSFKGADVGSNASTAPAFSFSTAANSSLFSIKPQTYPTGSIFGNPINTSSPVTSAVNQTFTTPSTTTSAPLFSFTSSFGNGSLASNTGAVSSSSTFGGTVSAASPFTFSSSFNSFKNDSRPSIFPSPTTTSGNSSATISSTTAASELGVSSSSFSSSSKTALVSPSKANTETNQTVQSVTVSAEQATTTSGRSTSTTTAITTSIAPVSVTTITTAITSIATATTNTLTTTSASTGVSVTSPATTTVTPPVTPATISASATAVSVSQTSVTTSCAKNESTDQQGESVRNEDVSGKSEMKEGNGKNVVVADDASSTQSTVPTNLAKNNAESNAFTSSAKTSGLPPSSANSVFTATAAGSAAPSVFSMPQSTATISFGSSVPPSDGKTIFAQAASTSVTTSNIFSNTTSSIFSPTKAVTTDAVFNAGTATTSSNIFGQSVATTVSSNNLFGQIAPTTTASSTFGQTGKDEVGQTAKLFGDVLGSGLSSGSVFETPSTSASGNIFGKTSFEKSGVNIFGNASTTTTSQTMATTRIFGGTSSIFSQVSSPFGNNTSSTSSGVFGQPQTTESSTSFFGQNICSSFGSSTTAAPNQNPFASTGGFNSKPIFSQSLFGQSPSGQNLFERSSTSNIFGGAPSTSSGGNIFQTSTSSFGNSPPGPFSGGQSSLGTAPSFQKPLGGFGGSPVFGSGLAPTFGAPPTFGGAPTFGSPPSFGNPQKIFGSPQGTFGQSQAHSPNFEALASQSTDGFANLAQQSQSQAFGGNTFNQSATFGSDTSFGGNSFSGWRS